MTLYLHLLGAFERPEEAESPEHVGWIHTIGPLESVAEIGTEELHLAFSDAENPLRDGLIERRFIPRIGQHLLFAGILYATFVVNAQRSYP